MKKWVAMLLVVMMLLTALSGCHKHEWSEATCTEPMTCACGATQGEPKGHDWKEATCTEPMTCACGATQGEPKGHDWKEATCTEPMTCACGAVQGEPIEHEYGDWELSVAPTYLESGKEAQVCRYCGDQKTRTVQNLKSRGLIDPDEFMESLRDTLDDMDYDVRISGSGYMYEYESGYISGAIAFSYVEEGKETQNDNGEGLCNNVVISTNLYEDYSSDQREMTYMNHVIMSYAIVQSYGVNLDNVPFIEYDTEDIIAAIDKNAPVERRIDFVTMTNSVMLLAEFTGMFLFSCQLNP